MIRCILGHQWGDWKQEDSCKKSRTCLRCNKKEIKEVHNFVLDHYDDNCIEIFVCEKCNKLKHGTEKHNWGKYKYYEEQCCTQVSVCSRCGATKYQEAVHDVIKYHRPGKCETVTECIRCHNKTVTSNDHTWHKSLHTYVGCLKFAKEQVESEIGKLQGAIHALKSAAEQNANEMELTNLRAKENMLSLERSTIFAKMGEIQNNEERNAPARVCTHCRFISKTGRRVERIDLRDIIQLDVNK